MLFEKWFYYTRKYTCWCGWVPPQTQHCQTYKFLSGGRKHQHRNHLLYTRVKNFSSQWSFLCTRALIVLRSENSRVCPLLLIMPSYLCFSFIMFQEIRLFCARLWPLILPSTPHTQFRAISQYKETRNFWFHAGNYFYDNH